VAVIQKLTTRLDHLERELARKNAYLEGRATPFPELDGPAPLNSPIPRSRSEASRHSGSRTHPSRSKSQQLQYKNPTMQHNQITLRKNKLMAEAKKAFQKADKDNSGTITKAELKTVMEEMRGRAMADSEINVLFSHLDVNKDGAISFKEFHEARPLRGKWVQGVGYRWDEGAGVAYNPLAWAAGNLADQAASGGKDKIAEKSKLIGMQVSQGAFKRQAMAGAALEPFVPSDATIRSDMTACVKHCHGTTYADWLSEKETKMGSGYFPKGYIPDHREHAKNRSESRQWLDASNKKIARQRNITPRHSFTKFADACINSNMSFTQSGGMPASGPTLPPKG